MWDNSNNYLSSVYDNSISCPCCAKSTRRVVLRRRKSPYDPSLMEENINHPCHPNHPLKLLRNGPPDYAARKCSLCQEELTKFLYHCPYCNFSVDMSCVNTPPPLEIVEPRCHEHPLTFMAREVSFTCNACGTNGERNPYLCSQCCLMLHRDCITLPHVINVNRHEHRVSHTYSLRHGNHVCGVCRQKIDWRYAAYSCLVCPSYVVHSKCATTRDVWDGVELEGVPEEVVDVAPFKVIDEDGTINHFSHIEHNLKLLEDAIIRDGRSMRCEACARPIYSDKYYSCIECSFILHEECASLPLRKRHWLYAKPLSLRASEGNNINLFSCDACQRISNGFMYECGDKALDVQCASMTWYSDYECHPHTLFLTTLHGDICGSCNEFQPFVLRCVQECKFCLDFTCATLPKRIKHKCDDHFLYLRYGENLRGSYWCEICEALIDLRRWFYTCDDCGVVCHISCLFGEFVNIKPGIIAIVEEKKVEVVPNDQVSRPKCAHCNSRSSLLFLFKVSYDNIEVYFCCLQCLRLHKFT